MKTKRYRTTIPGISSPNPIPHHRPSICPNCNSVFAPEVVVGTTLISNSEYAVIVFRCNDPDCLKLVFCLYKWEDQKSLTLLDIYPKFSSLTIPDVVSDLSPKYALFCNQAYAAEQNGDYELAGIGYRAAIEFLTKDYAITILNKPYEEVKDKKLAKAIELYLPDMKFKNSADVVRLLGNDNNHYVQEYVDYDFTTLKRFFDIFSSLLTMHIEAYNPPIKK